MDDASPAPPHHESSVVQAIERRLSPGMLLLIAVLALVLFIFGLLNLLLQSVLRLRRARRRRRRVGDAAAADGSSPTALQGQLGQLFHLHDAGVDQAFIDALPVFPYRAVAAAGRGNCKDKDPFDCAVCLCEFEEDDELRLLPTCGHAFHVPCIDAWLLAHSTCPLCRGSILSDFSPEYDSNSPFVLVLAAGSESAVPERDGRDIPGDGGSEEESPEVAEEEEIFEVKLGKLRCVDGGNASARDLVAVDITRSSSSNRLGQRRCLSMGSYEYVMDDRAALRVVIKTTTTSKRRRPASSTSSRRRHALSECDFGGSKKGAWVAAEAAAAASADAGRRADDGAASLNKDSFSVSKIWMVSSSRNEDARKSSELASGRRAASFRWPAMAAGWKKQHLRGEASWDVEEATSRAGDSTVPSVVEERPSLATTALLWASSSGGRQHPQSSKSGNHS